MTTEELNNKIGIEANLLRSQENSLIERIKRNKLSLELELINLEEIQNRLKELGEETFFEREERIKKEST